MERIITYNFSENLIENVASLLCDNFLKEGNDLSKVACVFGGKRPALFLRRELARKIKGSFLPPRTFSIDEFIDYTIADNAGAARISELDAAYTIYSLAKKHVPGLISGRKDFGDFLPWAREIISFIEQLDLEDIPSSALKTIQKSAAIGYEIPDNINHLLQHIIKLRDLYHETLIAKGVLSRGMRYRRAANSIKKVSLEEFEAVFFCNFYYLHATEQRLIKDIYDRKKGFCIFQGSQDNWSVLEKNSKQLNSVIRPKIEALVQHEFNLYQGFDLHSQVCLVREILGKVSKKKDTVIVLPQPEAAIPLLSEISSDLDEFNVSLGYPLKRSSLYALFDLLLKVQESKKDGKYYATDYLNLLKHPLVKNLKLGKDAALTRVLVHKLEELLQGAEDSSIGGSLFLSLGQIEGEDKIYLRTIQTLNNMNIEVEPAECAKVLEELHRLLFKEWGEVKYFAGFAARLEMLLNALVEKSMIDKFPFNLKVVEKLYEIKEELEVVAFATEKFAQEEIWEIFRQKLQSVMISFSGSPLRGTQILGLFETRSLSFENAIVMDMNESILPRLKIYEPLIPREVMLSLGLNRLEKEEEIQRYQFMRLIGTAKNVHLVYAQNEVNEKSRFIEELLWQRQKQVNKLEVASVPRASFSLGISSKTESIKKTPEIIRRLQGATYSASRLNTYLNCPARFYYQYILGLKEKENLSEGLQAWQIGNFIHELLEDAFKKLVDQKPIIDAEFKKYFFKLMEARFEKEIEQRMRADSFLLKGIITARLEKFLEREIERDVAKVISLEERIRSEMILNVGLIKFIYMVDRVDEFDDGSIVIIDYKTGGSSLVPKRLKSLQALEMTRRGIKDNIRSFQLPLYYYFTKEKWPKRSINAEFYNIRTLERNPFISKEDKGNEGKIMQICINALEFILREIFNPDVAFEADREERKCQACPFKGLCK